VVNSLKTWKTSNRVFWYSSARPRVFTWFAQCLSGPGKEGSKRAQCPRNRSDGGTEKSQQCRKYFLQYSTFTLKRPYVRTWGRQSCSLPQIPSNRGTTLVSWGIWSKAFSRSTKPLQTFPAYS